VPFNSEFIACYSILATVSLVPTQLIKQLSCLKHACTIMLKTLRITFIY